MNMKFILKTVSIILIFSMILGLFPIYSHAAGNSSDVNSFLSKIKQFFADLLSKFTGIFSKSFHSVAQDCKKVVRDNKFTYSMSCWDGGFSNNDDAKNPASSKRGYKTIDCSAYVGWTLFKYGCQTGKNEYKEIFKNRMSSGQILKTLSNNSDLFEKVGKLGNCELKPGDIIVKDGHAEIYCKTENGTYFCYTCGQTSDIQDSDLVSWGVSNRSTSSYTVFRVKK